MFNKDFVTAFIVNFHNYNFIVFVYFIILHLYPIYFYKVSGPHKKTGIFCISFNWTKHFFIKYTKNVEVRYYIILNKHSLTLKSILCMWSIGCVARVDDVIVVLSNLRLRCE
jgi:hypothetical protein